MTVGRIIGGLSKCRATEKDAADDDDEDEDVDVLPGDDVEILTSDARVLATTVATARDVAVEGVVTLPFCNRHQLLKGKV